MLQKLFKRRFSYSKLQEKLIDNSLPYVHKYGWSDNAIHSACSMMDLSPASHRLIRPYDLISYSMRNWNKTALRIIDDTNFDHQKSMHKKIHYAIQTRLTQQLQFIDTWHQAMALGAHYSNIQQTNSILWEYSDEIWHRCGDKSTDYNHYTKRILFNTAYATTQLHLLSDQSDNKVATWQFLERRLEDILQVGKTMNDLKTVGGAAVEGAWSLFEAFRQPNRKQMRQPINQIKDKREVKIDKIQKAQGQAPLTKNSQ